MNTTYLIPNIAAIKDGDKHNRKASEAWKDYFQKQDCVKTITDSLAIKAIIEQGFSLPETDSNVAFIVLFPRSFLHLKDFLSNLRSSSASAAFLEDGNVVIKLNDDQQIATYLGAWQEIVNRTTGKTSLKLIPEIVSASIDDLNKIKSNHKILKERLQNWVDKFNELPGVRADIHEDSIPDRLIEVSFSNPLNSENDAWSHWELNAPGTVEHLSGYGEMGEIYDDWENKILENSEKLSWQKFYDHVVELCKIYSTVPEFKTKEN
ncbi:hypothetical protein IT402_03165 [Candidatus Nomurabacteria bacterium]|nr:hypothetical protein [Candidatus Nomurabacteria bacterium]